MSGGLQIGSMHWTIGAEDSAYRRVMQNVDRLAASTQKGVSGSLTTMGHGFTNFGTSAVSSLQRIGETMTGVLVANAIPKLMGALQGLGREGFEAVRDYEKLGLALEAMAERDVMEAATLEKSIVVGQRKVELTEEEREKLGDLYLQRDLMNAQMNEESERIRQLTERYGEQGLTVIEHNAALAIKRERYSDLVGAIGALEGKEGGMANITKRVTEVVLDENVAKAKAAQITQELLGWIEKVAVQSPFTQAGVQEAYKMASAYGFVSQQVIDLSVETGKMTQKQADGMVSSQRLTQALIDFAAGTGASEAMMADIARAAGQIQAKGKLSGQEVLQLTNSQINLHAILAKELGKTTAEIIEMQEKGLIPADVAIQALVKSIEDDFGGAALEQTRSFAGLVSTLSDLKTIGLRELLTSPLEEAQPHLAAFVDMLSSDEFRAKIQALGAALGDKVAVAMDRLLQAGAAFKTDGLGGVMEVLGVPPGVVDVLERAAGAVEDVVDAVRGLVGSGIGWIKDEVLPRLQDLFGAVGEKSGVLEGAIKGITTALIAGGAVAALGTLLGLVAGLVNPVTLLIGAAAALGVAWETNFGGIQEKTAAIADAVGPALETIKGGFGDLVTFFQGGEMTGPLAQYQGQIDGFLAKVQEIGDKIGTFFAPTIERLRTGFDQMMVSLEPVGTKLGELWTAAEPVLEKLGTFIGTTLVVAFDLLGEIVAAVMPEVGGIIESAINIGIGVFETLNGLIDGIVTAVSALVEGDFGAAWEAVKGMFGDLGGLAETIGTEVGKIGESLLGALTEAIGNWWDNLNTATGGKLQEVLDGITTWFTSIPEMITGWMEGPAQAVRDFDLKQAFIDLLAAGAIGFMEGIDSIATFVENYDWAGLATRVWDGFKASLSTASATTATALAGASTSISTWLGEAWTTISTYDYAGAIKTAMQTVVTGIPGKTVEILGSIGTVLTQIGDKIGKHSFESKTMTAIGTIIGGVTKKAGEVLTSVATFMTDIAKEIEKTDLATVGWNLITSLADSIWSRATTYLREKAEGVADQLPGWVKRILGIASPSRVFYEIGLNIIAGLVEGVQDRAPEAIEAMASLLKGIADIFEGMSGFRRFRPVENLAEFVAGVNEQLKTIVTVFNQFAAWSYNYGNVLPQLAETASQLSSVVKAIVDAVEMLDAVGEFQAVADLGAKMTQIAEALQAAVVAVAGLKGQTTEDAASAVAPLGFVVATLAEIAKGWETVRGIRVTAADVQPVLDFLTGFAVDAFDTLAEAAAEWEDAPELFGAFLDDVTAAVAAMAEIGAAWAGLAELEWEAIDLDALVGWARTVMERMTGLMDEIGPAPEGFDAFVGSVQAAVSAVSDIAAALTSMGEAEGNGLDAAALQALLEGLRPQAEAIFDWFGALWAEIEEQEEAAAAAAEAAGTVVAPIKAILEAVADLGEEGVGTTPIQGVLDTLRPQVEAIFDWFDELWAAVQEYAPGAEAAAASAAKVVAPVKALVDAMQALYNAEQGTLDGILAHLRPRLEQVFAFFDKVWADIAQYAPGAEAAAASTAKVVAPVKALVDAMQALYNAEQGALDGILAHLRPRLEQVFAFFDKVWADIAQYAPGAEQAAASTAKVVAPVKALVDAMQALYDAEQGTLDGILAHLRPRLAEVFKFFERVWADIAQYAPGAEAAAASVTKVVAPVKALVDAMQALYNAEQGVLGGILANLRPKILELFKFFERVWRDVQEFAPGAEQAAASVAKVVAPVRAVVEAMQALYDAKGGDIATALTTLQPQVEAVFTWFDQLWAKVQEKAVTAEAAAEAAGKVVAPVRAITEAVQALVEAGKDKAGQGDITTLLADMQPKIEAVFTFFDELWTKVKAKAEASQAAATAAGVLADNMGKMLSFLVELKEWRALPDLQDRFDAFKKTWEDILDKLTKAQLLTDEAAYTQAKKWAEHIAVLSDYLRRGMEFLNAVRDYAKVAVTAIDAFLADWGLLLTKLLTIFDGETTGDLVDEMVLQAAEATTKIIAGLQSAVELLESIREYVQVPETAFDDFKADYQRLLEDFADWVLEGDGWKLADDVVKGAAENAGTIASGLLDSMTVLEGIREYVQVPAVAFDAFTADYQRLLLDFATWALGEGKTVGEDLVGAVADNAQTIAAALRDAMAVLAQVIDYESVGAALQAFETDYQALLLNFATWARTTGVTVADEVVGAVADNASKIATALRGALDVLKDVVEYTGVGAALEVFKADYQTLFQDFATWALSDGKTLADEVVGAVATNAGKIADALVASVEVLTSIVEYVGVGTALDAFEADYQALMESFAEWALGEGAIVAEAAVGAVATNTQATAGGLRDALEVLTRLDEYARPSFASIGLFVSDVAEIMQEFYTQIVTVFAPEAAIATEAWGDATGAVASGLTEGLELLGGLHFYVNVANDRMDAFIADVAYLFGKVSEMATAVDAETVTAVAAFGQAVSSMVSGLSSALGLFGDLAELSDAQIDFMSGVYTPGASPTSQAAQRLGILYNAINNTITTFKTNVIDQSGLAWIPAANLFFDAIDQLIGVLKNALSLFVDLEEHGVPDLTKVQALVNAVIQLFSTFTTELGKTGTQVNAAGTTVNTTFDGILTGLPTTGEATGRADDITAGLIAGLNTNLTGTALTTLAGMAGSVTTTANAAVTNLQTTDGATGRADDITAGIIAGLGVNLTGSTTTTLQGLAGDVAAKANAAVTGLQTTDGAKTRADDITAGIIAGLGTNVSGQGTGFLTGMASDVAAKANAAVTGLTTTADATARADDIGAGIIAGLGTNVTGITGSNTVEGKARTLTKTVYDLVNDNIQSTEQATARADDIPAGFIAGLQVNASGTATTTVEGRAKWLAQLVGSTVSTNVLTYGGATTMGDAIDQGLIDGMMGKGDSVVETARTVAEAIVQEFRTTLVMSSPSKVAANVGEMFGQGLVIGMDASAADVLASAADMAGMVTAPFGDLRAELGAFTTGADVTSRREVSITLEVVDRYGTLNPSMLGEIKAYLRQEVAWGR